MVSLAVINLAWLIFDAVWAVEELRALLLSPLLPESWLADYAAVHARFFRIDLIFVSIFAGEFLLRWGHALRSRRYPTWYAFPILHWYDILGCIPVAGLRWLRVLRIFAILYRLQRMGYIDYRNWYLYQLARRLYEIVMEEISDRVVLRVLGGVQQEISASHDLERRVVEEVLLPRQQLIIDALRSRVVSLAGAAYRGSRQDLHALITRSVSHAVRENREIRRLDRIPVVGGMAGNLLDQAVTDIVCRVFDELAGEMGGADFAQLFDDIAAAVFSSIEESVQGSGARDQISTAINDMLEVVKQQIAQRRWLQDPQGNPADSPSPATSPQA